MVQGAGGDAGHRDPARHQLLRARHRRSGRPRRARRDDGRALRRQPARARRAEDPFLRRMSALRWPRPLRNRHPLPHRRRAEGVLGGGSQAPGGAGRGRRVVPGADAGRARLELVAGGAARGGQCGRRPLREPGLRGAHRASRYGGPRAGARGEHLLHGSRHLPRDARAHAHDTAQPDAARAPLSSPLRCARPRRAERGARGGDAGALHVRRPRHLP